MMLCPVIVSAPPDTATRDTRSATSREVPPNGTTSCSSWAASTDPDVRRSVVAVQVVRVAGLQVERRQPGLQETGSPMIRDAESGSAGPS